MKLTCLQSSVSSSWTSWMEMPQVQDSLGRAARTPPRTPSCRKDTEDPPAAGSLGGAPLQPVEVGQGGDPGGQGGNARIAPVGDPGGDPRGDAPGGRGLSPPDQSPQAHSGAFVGRLHSPHRGGVGLPRAQARPHDPTNPSLERGSGGSASTLLVSGLRALLAAGTRAPESRREADGPTTPGGSAPDQARDDLSEDLRRSAAAAEASELAKPGTRRDPQDVGLAPSQGGR